MHRSTDTPDYLKKAVKSHPLKGKETFERKDGTSFKKFAQHVPYKDAGQGIVQAQDDYSIWEVRDGQVFRVRDNSEIEQALAALAAAEKESV